MFEAHKDPTYGFFLHSTFFICYALYFGNANSDESQTILDIYYYMESLWKI